MNTKDLLSVLHDFQQLASISYEQLDKLLLQFPYCHNLRLLLLKKYQNDEHRAFDRQLSLASTYCPDRQFLNKFVQSTPVANKVIPIQKEEEILALLDNKKEEEKEVMQELATTTIKKTQEKELSSDKLEENKNLVAKNPIEEVPEVIEQPIEKENLPVQKQEEKTPTPTVIHKVSQTPPRLDLMEILSLQKEAKEFDADDEDMSFVPLEKWVQSFTPPRINDKSDNGPQRKRFKLSRIPVFEDDRMLELFGGSDQTKQEKKTTPTKEKEALTIESQEEIIEQPTKEEVIIEIEEKPITPPKKSFDFFADSTEAFLKSLSNKKQKKNKSTSNHLDDSVKESVTENEEVISETLADLLALQGKKDKAIKMYKALSLKFPEKNLFFAEKIEELSREV